MPNYEVLVGPALAASSSSGDVQESFAPMPLREVVALCLERWEITSDTSDESSDEFCGWRVGSRALSASGWPQSLAPTKETPVGRGYRAPSHDLMMLRVNAMRAARGAAQDHGLLPGAADGASQQVPSRTKR